MRKTRNSKPAPGSQQAEASLVGPSLPPSSTNPPTLFVLPRDRSSEARILSLPDPSSGRTTRYFFDPISGLHEFTNVSSQKSTPSSWLLAADPESQHASNDNGSQSQSGYAIEQPNMLVATPIDLIFMILPTLLADSESSERQLFLTIDDYLEKISVHNKDLADILGSAQMLPRLERRMKSVCDIVEAGEDNMYRANTNKLAREFLRKAERMAAGGLPASMEKALVEEALQAPATVLELPCATDVGASQQTDATTLTQTSSFSSTVSLDPDSQASELSTSSIATAATSVSGDDRPEPDGALSATIQIKRLLRLRTACDFLLAAYVRPSFRVTLRSAITEAKSVVDFSPLEEHLKRLEGLKKEAQALRSLSDNISRKRRSGDDDEAEAIRAEKRRKKEEEDAKKKAQSRAIKQLFKTDTSGMKKLSSFFTKAPAKKSST
ncbi:hypothetical protein ANO11243_060830 [Dothideomycetidae sp. 11243]|nr:hypothetical protein ANO11243_060830 [fungal sp. No.11243]